MKSKRASIIALLMIVSMTIGTTFGSFTEAAGSRFEIPRVRWKGRAVRLAVSDSVTQPNFNVKTGSDVWGAIRGSIKAWQSVADIEFEIEESNLQSVSPSGTSGDGVSIISIAQTPENVVFFSRDPYAESAKTRVFHNGKGFITEADIILNPLQQFSTDGTFGTFDLESTLTHEIGHLLGLRHTDILGATMSEALPKNGVFGSFDFGTRSLAESDISAVRELYGAGSGDEACCALITGRLSFESGRAARNIRVWAEDNETGRVVAQVDTAGDGSFRIGGIPNGTYALFWRKKEASLSAIGELGLVKAEIGESKIVNEKIALRRFDSSLLYVGLNGQLTDSAISLSPGREYKVFLGGVNLDPANLTIDFNSPFVRVSRSSISEHDFGEGISALSFVVNVHENTPTGVYSIFVSGSDGEMAALIGALNIE